MAGPLPFMKKILATEITEGKEIKRMMADFLTKRII